MQTKEHVVGRTVLGGGTCMAMRGEELLHGDLVSSVESFTTSRCTQGYVLRPDWSKHLLDHLAVHGVKRHNQTYLRRLVDVLGCSDIGALASFDVV